MSETSDLLVWQNAVFLVKQLPPAELYRLINKARRSTAPIKTDYIFIAQHFNSEIETQIKDAIELEYLSLFQAEPVLSKTKELSAILNRLHKQENYHGK
jgi:hypothetical protein